MFTAHQASELRTCKWHALKNTPHSIKEARHFEALHGSIHQSAHKKLNASSFLFQKETEITQWKETDKRQILSGLFLDYEH